MLRIRAATSPQYYEQREFARDDYYSGHERTPGQWIGRGAELLELHGAPGPGELGALLEGRHPESGEPIGRSASLRNAGFDLTFTAPKSVSVLLAVGDERVRQAVLAAHQAGVRAALDYLEREACFVRRGHAGAQVLPAHGFAGAMYHHEMARSGDPHLHTHLVIGNAVRGADGRWSAPDMRAVYAAAKAAGALQEAVLRHALTRALGVAWRPAERWGHELREVPEAVLAHFSRRQAEIMELAYARGWLSMRGIQAIQRETRDDKPQLERGRAQAVWRARAAEHGFGERKLQALLGQGHAPLAGPRATLAERRLVARLAGPAGLTERASTFSTREVILALAEGHPDGLRAGELEAHAKAFLARDAVAVEPARGHRPATYTTPDLLLTEARLVLAAARPAPGAAEVDARALADVLAARSTLGPDQRGALEALVAGTEAVRVLEAPAGTGKTYLLGALVEVYERSGVLVLGTAWQGQAAQLLAHEAGLQAETTARLLAHLEAGRGTLPPGCVLVVDEAGMMPTRPLERLLAHVAAADGVAVLVGDRAQLPAIDAGGAFAGLAERLGAPALTENRRQRDPLQRAVAGHLRAGRAGEALSLLEDSGRLHTFADATEARAALVADWAERALPRPGRCLIVTHDNAEVAALNRLARERLEGAGLLGAERLVACGREWAAGDRLVCRRNDYRPDLEVRNGTRGTVLAVDRQAGSLWIATDEGRQVHLPPDYLAHAHHAYALTGHVSQGATVDYTYLLASPARGGREWAYVAASRQRIDLCAYLTHHEPEAAREALAAAWERSQGKHLALDRLPAHAAAQWLAHAQRAAQGLRREPDQAPASRPRPAPATRPASGPRLGLGP